MATVLLELFGQKLFVIHRSHLLGVAGHRVDPERPPV